MRIDLYILYSPLSALSTFDQGMEFEESCRLMMSQKVFGYLYAIVKNPRGLNDVEQICRAIFSGDAGELFEV